MVKKYIKNTVNMALFLAKDLDTLLSSVLGCKSPFLSASDRGAALMRTPKQQAGRPFRRRGGAAEGDCGCARPLFPGTRENIPRTVT